ncbi:MAG: serine/threonine protein kinase, partial [Spirulina sp. DLM2.Bin59]
NADRLFCLVQEWVQGVSLRQWVEQRGPMSGGDMVAIAQQILPILTYLHSLNPPVIHRDIKPDNLIRRPDGQIYLVDFGAVQDVYRNSISYASTFVGTLGYMPLEQMRGHTRPTSDLYSLGMTLRFLLTGKDPAPLALDRPQGPERLPLSPERQAWLMRLVAPAPEDRWPSGAIAAQHLSPEALTSPSPSTQPLLTLEFDWQTPDRHLLFSYFVLALVLYFLIKNISDVSNPHEYALLLSFFITIAPLIVCGHQVTLKLEQDHFIIDRDYIIFNREYRGSIEDIFILEYRAKTQRSKHRSWLEHYVVMWEGVKPHWLLCESEEVAQEMINQIQAVLEEKRHG